MNNKNMKRTLVSALVSASILSQAGCSNVPNEDEPIVRWWDEGIAGLAYFGGKVLELYNNNFVDTNANYPENVECSTGAEENRMVDGNCNDLDQTRMGSVGVRFGRNVSLESAYPDENLMKPNPRLVSEVLMTRDGIKEVDFLSYWAAAWIQFMVHDWMAHQNSESEYHSVPLEEDDPLYSELGPEMLIAKTIIDPSWSPYEGTPPAYVNRLTHWWDGSQLYGSDEETNRRLRTLQDGKLKLTEQGRLPVDPVTGEAVTGFAENWWLGLQMFHELFAKEHNAIAAMLKEAYPDWNDDQLFNKARMINAAIMAKIHTVDWTPSILNNPTAKLAMNADWDVVVGGNKKLRGVPFSLTEEFVAVYRMHPLIRDSVDIVNYQTGGLIENVPTEDQAFRNAEGVLNDYGTANVFYSFGVTHPGQITTNNFPKFLQNLRMPDGTVMDLAAVDILRDRERGVPRYNEFRRQLHMPPIRDFTDLTPDVELAEKLREVYDDDVEAIDVMVGQLAEGYRPDGFGFSDTTFRIFTMMAPRRFQGDRFYTNDFNNYVYTPEGMEWIKNADFKSVIVRHVQELRSAMANVGNPFFPWNTDSSNW